MPDRIRTFPVTQEFTMEHLRETAGPGDQLELRRDTPEQFFSAQIVKKDGRRIEIELSVAELMFRNGALG